jgi:hypothetical protein
MLKATRYAMKVVGGGYGIVVVETVIGRKEPRYRSGLIYRSFDRFRRDHAIEYINLALSLAGNADIASIPAFSGSSREKAGERVSEAIKKCELIQEELGL